jgi:hypothetical protein
LLASSVLYGLIYQRTNNVEIEGVELSLLEFWRGLLVENTLGRCQTCCERKVKIETERHTFILFCAYSHKGNRNDVSKEKTRICHP